MRLKQGRVAMLALALIVGVGILAYRYEGSSAQVCRLCERDIHPGTAFRIDTREGLIRACCPRCGMHYQIQHGEEVQQAWATDLNTGEALLAESAYYVEGGEVEYCTLHQSPVRRTEQPGSVVRSYDRCLPNLVAFRTESDAREYQARHGGRVSSYPQARESARHH